MNDEARNQRNFYGRIKGKTLTPTQRERLDAYLPTIQVRDVETGKVDLPAQFDNDKPIWLEIGFGAGEHLAHIAGKNPDVNFVGCEPFINGVAAALRHFQNGNLSNVRVHPWDARALFDALPDATFERVYLLYPDPWPKARHAERRFMHPDNLKEIARLLKPGCELRLASDIPEYIDHGLEKIGEVPEFSEVSRDRKEPWEGWFRTRYEAKAIRENRTPQYVIFKRK